MNATKHTLIDLATILPADLVGSPTATQHVWGAAMGNGAERFERVDGSVYRLWGHTDEALLRGRRAAEAAARALAD